MSRTAAVARQSPAIIIALVALSISLAGGAWATTRDASHANSGIVPRAVTWSSITLVNGWASSQALYASGDPRVSSQNGIVYLSGSIHQGTAGSPLFATLPLAYRPAHNMWITVYTNGGTSGTLYIGHDGTMQASSTASCSTTFSAAQCYTSLATVSYPKSS